VRYSATYTDSFPPNGKTMFLRIRIRNATVEESHFNYIGFQGFHLRFDISMEELRKYVNLDMQNVGVFL
jgi:hypothetical protein